MKKTIIFGLVALFIVSLFFFATDKIYSVSCVDLDDPATWGGKIVLSEYDYYIVKDDVVLCNKTYDFSGGKSIMIGYPNHSAVDVFDCNGATIIGGGKIEGTGPLISVTCNLSAPYLPCYANLTVKNCKLQNADSGIAVNHANYTTLENNEVTNTNYGTMIWGAEDCKVKNSVSSGNTYYGFSIEDDIGSRHTKRCNVEGNTAENNGRYGINLNSADDSIVTKNTVRNNTEKGIYVYDSNNNLIYNNIFENLANSYCHANSSNSWHITPTLGLNIINGPSIGGNFWSDYSGADNDYDGFGDTQYSILGDCGQFDDFPLVPVDIPPDTDGDGIDDTADNCVLIANPDQKDFDADGIGDVCDADSDNDGIDNDYDLCPETKLTENFIRLLPKHFGLINGDSVFETRDKLLGDIIEGKYTLADTSGCNCQQILELKPGANIGEQQFGCTEATIKNFNRN